MSKRQVVVACLLFATSAAAPTPLVSQVLVDMGTRQGPDLPKAELLVLTSDHTMFRLRTTLAEARTVLRPGLDRGYSLFCGNWHAESANVIVTTDRLAESYQYPALEADRAGQHRMTLTTTGSGKAELPATARSSDHAYSVVRKLSFDPAEVERIRFTCAQASTVKLK